MRSSTPNTKNTRVILIDRKLAFGIKCGDDIFLTLTELKIEAECFLEFSLISSSVLGLAKLMTNHHPKISSLLKVNQTDSLLGTTDLHGNSVLTFVTDTIEVY